MAAVNKARLRFSALLLASLALLPLWLFLDGWRKQVPAPIGTASGQRAMMDQLANWCGIELPSGARIIVYSGEDERDGRYYHWVVFSDDEIVPPGSLERMSSVFPTQLHESAQTVEDSMLPHKIEEPRIAKDYGWSHGYFHMIAIVVGGKKGWYMYLEADRQDSAATGPP